MLDVVNNPRPAALRHLAAATLLAGPALALDPLPVRAEAASLFHHAPRARLRPLATDRASKTESPYTVAPGQVQVEVELFRFAREDQSSDAGHYTREGWATGTTLLELGLLPTLDAGLGLEPYRQERESAPVEGAAQAGRRVTRREGFGSLSLRLKWNLWGNDDGGSALALLSEVVLPTGQDDLDSGAVEPALFVPFALNLGRGFALGAQTGFVWAGDADGRGHHFEAVNSVTLGVELGPRWDGYVEFWSLVDATAPAAWQGSYDFGLNFWVNQNLKLDAGLNVGVTDAAPDWEPFLRLSWSM